MERENRKTLGLQIVWLVSYRQTTFFPLICSALRWEAEREYRLESSASSLQANLSAEKKRKATAFITQFPCIQSWKKEF
ncbi:hypothetical protein CEXT_27211 [Caerostris extrusa]|uniref:Uncharacterized protein n=1 Tax=Caerostris extrusa TaxID=172846 RepID=A0AAV4QW89_CAEEX|nr:hypothetical protein CEXT_27211 [Caerostris extrusa]